jgi:hypothetical protein
MVVTIPDILIENHRIMRQAGNFLVSRRTKPDLPSADDPYRETFYRTFFFVGGRHPD